MICCDAGNASSGGGFFGAGAFLRMLSRLSFLSARNSGWRNSQACRVTRRQHREPHNSRGSRKTRKGGGQPTSRPYGDSPFSSLCLTLWKSYLFNWRTKLAKLLCLKCFGRMFLVNFSFYSRQSQDGTLGCDPRGKGHKHSYLQDHKAIAFGAPSYHRVVRGIL